MYEVTNKNFPNVASDSRKEGIRELPVNNRQNPLPGTIIKDEFQDSGKRIEMQAVGEKELKAILRNLGLKVTDQRMTILKSLYGNETRHTTAQQLFENVIEIDKSIGFATVYRLLRKLTDSHLMTETRMGGVSARYELNSIKHHDHLTCEACGSIVEFENDEIEKLQEQVAYQFGFRLSHHVLELFGVCPRCQKEKAKI